MNPWKQYNPQNTVVPAGTEVSPTYGMIPFHSSITPEDPVVQATPFTPPSLTHHRPWSKRSWHGRLCLWLARRCAQDCTQALRDTLAGQRQRPGGMWAQGLNVLCMGVVAVALSATWVYQWSHHETPTRVISGLMTGSFLGLFLYIFVGFMGTLLWSWYFGHAEEMTPNGWVEANTLLSGHPEWVPDVIEWRHRGPWRVRDLRCLRRAYGEQIRHSRGSVGQFIRLFRPSKAASLEDGPLGGIVSALEMQDRLQDMLAPPESLSPITPVRRRL